jgi:hypothetical protein
MPFGSIGGIDPSAFGTPNLGAGFLESYLAGQNVRKNQMAMDEVERSRADQERIKGAMSGFDPSDPEAGIAALMKVSPQSALEMRKALADSKKADVDLRNAQLTGDKTIAETGEKRIQFTEKQRSIIGGEAVSAQHYLNALPPDRRNIQGLAPFLTSRANFYRAQGAADIADGLLGTIQNPNAIENIKATARGHGYKDPDEEMRRDVLKSNLTAQFQNQQPPTQFQQQQLGLERQKFDQQGRQALDQQMAKMSEQQRNEARWLIDKHDAAPETITYKRVLPKANAVLSAIQSTDPQSDLDIMMGLTNILDELGSVRESDIANIKGAGGWSQWYDNLKSELNQQGKLGPESRQGIANIVSRRMKEYEGSYMAHKGNLDAMAQRSGLNPADIFAGPMAFAGRPQQAQAPAGGQQSPAPTGFSAPAPGGGRQVSRDALYAQARQLAQARPDKLPKIKAWLQQQGLDPAGL